MRALSPIGFIAIHAALILITNKTVDKKSSHNPYMQDYAQFFVQFLIGSKYNTNKISASGRKKARSIIVSAGRYHFIKANKAAAMHSRTNDIPMIAR